MTYFLAFGGKSLNDFDTSSLTTLSKLRNALSGSRNVLLYVVSQMVFLDSSSHIETIAIPPLAKWMEPALDVAKSRKTIWETTYSKTFRDPDKALRNFD